MMEGFGQRLDNLTARVNGAGDHGAKTTEVEAASPPFRRVNTPMASSQDKVAIGEPNRLSWADQMEEHSEIDGCEQTLPCWDDADVGSG